MVSSGSRAGEIVAVVCIVGEVVGDAVAASTVAEVRMFVGVVG